MATTEPANLKSDLDELFLLARKGEISKSSKANLERYAAVLCSTEARLRMRDPEFLQIGETVRTLLIVRMSEEANKEGTRISRDYS